MNTIITTHNLDFEVTPFRIQIEGEPMNMCFKVGTCHGLYCVTDNSYDIIAINNEEKGNGHLDDVFQWFENSCKRDKKNLRVMEFYNERFKNHLIAKRGFQKQGENNVIKYFNTRPNTIGIIGHVDTGKSTITYRELMVKLKTASVPMAKEAQEALARYIEPYSIRAKIPLPEPLKEPVAPLSGKQARNKRREAERRAKNGK